MQKGKFSITLIAFRSALALTLVLLTACSKVRQILPKKGFGNQVSWRFVVYDSTSSVVDSTSWISFTDSLEYPPLLGPSVSGWQQPDLGIIVGPYNLGAQFDNTQIVKGGCGVTSFVVVPTLDRTGWNLQRSENGKVIDMFTSPVDSSYDGKYNDFPYPAPDGLPSPWESNEVDISWICGTTAGSCKLFPL